MRKTNGELRFGRVLEGSTELTSEASDSKWLKGGMVYIRLSPSSRMALRYHVAGGKMGGPTWAAGELYNVPSDKTQKINK